MANAHGDRTYLAAKVSDATGITTTITTAGTPVALKSATLVVASESSASCPYTLDAEDGTITVSSRHGAGTVRLTAMVGRCKGANDAVVEGSWHRTRGETTTELTPRVCRTEPAAAIDADLGPCIVLDDAQVDDVYDFRFDSDTNSDTVVTKEALLLVEKLESSF